MEIVRMDYSHTETLADLEKLCFAQPWSKKSLDEQIKNPIAYFIVAMEEDAILGYGGMHCTVDECYVDNVAVFRHQRKRGVGTAIISDMIKEATSRQGRFVSLEARPSNKAAVSLYKKLGFVEEGRRKNFYSDPKEDALILTRWLNGNKAG